MTRAEKIENLARNVVYWDRKIYEKRAELARISDADTLMKMRLAHELAGLEELRSEAIDELAEALPANMLR